jgi:hypothetical protein
MTDFLCWNLILPMGTPPAMTEFPVMTEFIVLQPRFNADAAKADRSRLS